MVHTVVLIPGVEQQHDALAAVIRQTERSVGARQLEVRCRSPTCGVFAMLASSSRDAVAAARGSIALPAAGDRRSHARRKAPGVALERSAHARPPAATCGARHPRLGARRGRAARGMRVDRSGPRLHAHRPRQRDTEPTARGAATQRLLDWPEFGLDPQRSDVSELSTGITAANVAHLHRITVTLPGTVDSSPIYLHGASVGGASHNVAVVSTTYGKTIALDADSGRILWTFTPAGYCGWAGSSQITTTSPLADPGGQFVYAASPNGLIHKLSLSNGVEQSGLARARHARSPSREDRSRAQHRRSRPDRRHRRLFRRRAALPGPRRTDRPLQRERARRVQHAVREPRAR